FRQSGARRRLPRWVANHRREVAEDEHRGVPTVLEPAQPAQHDRETEVDVGGGWVDTELHPQWTALLEPRPQLLAGDDVDGVGGEQLELTVDVHPVDGNKPRS